ncbi:MAG TPA: CehA/McbA family metallohydrolase [Solimonas sp.]|nr:CehA/McbA family metallohydrolase [Solimonas sp.]
MYLVLLLGLLLSACGGHSGSAAPVVAALPDAPSCAPGQPPIELTGSASTADAKTYRELPFTVMPGTGRVEVSYGWADKAGPPSTPLTATTFDLGLWDQHGYRSAAGFRGWSGSRQGRIDQGKPPVFVEAGQADRGYVPGTIEPGTWFADLGIAAVAPQGSDWTVKIECKAAGGTTPAFDPVDKTHVARLTPDWYHGDLHMHAFHSNPEAPDWDTFIARSRAAQLDFLMVTEYVTGQHWRTLGAVQRANPDLLVWPGREVITYFGHANTHGETPSVLEYRHGFEDVSLREIQRLAKADGALFQVNHPTIFPPPAFNNLCRGCYFELGDQIDWDQVDTLEVMNSAVLSSSSDIGLPGLPVMIEQPFLATALQLWDDLLKQGHKITAVSGSDSKGVEPDDAEIQRRGWGCSATAVYAPELSRAAIGAALHAGHAYIRTRGVARSPALEFTVATADGQSGMFGDTVTLASGASATLRTTVTGGANQLLTYYRNGLPVRAVPITSDPFVDEYPDAGRDAATEGPLGTYWRIETRDVQTRTAIGNPVFLRAP